MVQKFVINLRNLAMVYSFVTSVCIFASSPMYRIFIKNDSILQENKKTSTDNDNAVYFTLLTSNSRINKYRTAL